MEKAEGGGGVCWAEVAGRQRAGLLIRAGPCQPTGWGDGPSPGTVNGPGQPGHDRERAGPGLGRAKKPGYRAGCRAAGCMNNYSALTPCHSG